MVIITSLIKRVGNKEGNEKGIDKLAPLLLMMQQQKPNQLESLM